MWFPNNKHNSPIPISFGWFGLFQNLCQNIYKYETPGVPERKIIEFICVYLSVNIVRWQSTICYI